MAKTTVRELTEGDLDAAAHIEARAFSNLLGKDLDEAYEVRLCLEISSRISMELGWALVIEEGGVLIGVCHGTPDWDWNQTDAVPDVGKVTGLAVTPEAWGQGHGRALLSSSLDLMRNRHFQHARVWVGLNNSRAIGLYESFGFQRTGRLETDDGDKVVEYELDL